MSNLIDEYLPIYRAFVAKLGDDIISWARPDGWPVGPTSVINLKSYILIADSINYVLNNRIGLLYKVKVHLQ